MRIITLCAIVVVATAAPQYSSRQYQFQRSSSAYRNNELQHKNEEAGAYGRIEDPDKYDKPLEHSQYRQTSYHAPGSDTDSEEDIPSRNSGLKGHRQVNHHRGGGQFFGQGVIDSDYTTGDSFYQSGRYHQGQEYQGHGYHQHGYHHPGFSHNHGYEHHHRNEETSSVSTQNKDDQLISLDQTFDYSKFKDHGFGKEYLENTEGQRTTPKTVVKPIFEQSEDVSEPGFSSQIGNNGRGIQQNTFGQSTTAQTFQQGQSTTGQVFHEDQSSNGQFGSLSQTGNSRDKQQVDLGQSFLQGQTFQQGTTTGQSLSQTGNSDDTQQQVDISQIFQDQLTNGQIGSASQIGNSEDTQQQVDVGQSFLQGQTFQQGQTSQQGQTTTGQFGSGSQIGQTFQQGQTTSGQFGSGSQIGNTQQKVDMSQIFQDQLTNGQIGSASQVGDSRDTQQKVDISGIFEDQSTNGQIGSGSQDTQQQVDIGQSFLQGQSTTGQTFQQGQSTTGQGQSTVQGQGTPDHLKTLFDQIDKIGTMDSQMRDHLNSNFGSGRQYHSGRQIIHHTTGYVKPKYESDILYQHQEQHQGQHQEQHQHSGFDEPDCQHKEYQQHTPYEWKFENHHKMEEKVEELTTQQKIEELTTQEKLEEMTTQEALREMTTQEALREMTTQARETTEQPKQEENMEMTKQEKQEEKSEGNFGMADRERTTTEYYQHTYQEKHEGYGQVESDDFQQQHQHEYGQFDYDGQHEDLTQQQQTQDAYGKINFDSKEHLTQQQQQHEWNQFEDLSQKHEDQNEEYGHLEFGGQQQQQEDLSQKTEHQYGYGSGRYSTASSNSYSSSYGRTHNFEISQNKEFATEVQDVSQQVQKLENPYLEAQKDDEQPEEIGIVTEEKTTQKPGFWKRLGGSITRTYESAKEKVKNNLG